jgi:hypothetical protein
MTVDPRAVRRHRDTLRERLAAIEHERWADWQRYLHSKATDLIGSGGALVIPADLVERWERQIATPYADLSEAEKDADREQVDRYWPLVAELQAEATDPTSTRTRAHQSALNGNGEEPKVKRVHYRKPGGYLCGVGRRWTSQVVTSSACVDAVTCASCRRHLLDVYPEATP